MAIKGISHKKWITLPRSVRMVLIVLVWIPEVILGALYTAFVTAIEINRDLTYVLIQECKRKDKRT